MSKGKTCGGCGEFASDPNDRGCGACFNQLVRIAAACDDPAGARFAHPIVGTDGRACESWRDRQKDDSGNDSSGAGSREGREPASFRGR